MADCAIHALTMCKRLFEIIDANFADLLENQLLLEFAVNLML